MNMEKVKAAFADETFVKSLFELDTVAEVQAALQEKGVEMSEEEILGIRELLIKVESGEISVEQLEQWAAQMQSGELSDELLEQVAGGVALTAMGVIAVVGMVATAVGIVTGIIKAATGRHW